MNRQHRRAFILGTLLTLVGLGMGRAAMAQSVTVPNAYANTSTGIEVAGAAGTRHQQIFSGSQFWPASETHQLRSLAFRPGSALFPGTYTWTLSHIEIYVCTTQETVEGLSPIFARNFATSTDRTLVYSGPITFSATLVETDYVSPSAILPTALVLSPSALVGGATATGTVSLSAPAPVGGFSVQLSSSSPSATVPVSVLVPEGQSSARFSVPTTAVAATTVAQVSASANGTVAAGTLTIDPAPVAPPTGLQIAQLTVHPTTLQSGEQGDGKVVLSGKAPVGSVTITLSSANPSALSVPASVFIPAGEKKAEFKLTAQTVASTTRVSVTATLAGVSTPVLVTVRPR